MQVLPQQQLLLELLVMSGQIAVTGDPQDTILWRTIKEGIANGWITLREASPEFYSIEITQSGRRAAGFT